MVLRLSLVCACSASAIETQSLRREAEPAQLMIRELGIARDAHQEILTAVRCFADGADPSGDITLAVYRPV